MTTVSTKPPDSAGGFAVSRDKNIFKVFLKNLERYLPQEYLLIMRMIQTA